MIKYLYKVNKQTSLRYFFSKLVKKSETITSPTVQSPIIRTKPGVVLNQASLQALSQLSQTDKSELKLFIPTPPFNPRLPMAKQQEYLPTITSQLYDLQKSLFQSQIRILQSLTQSNLNKYLNLIYKDIYTRFLISKKIGISWEGRYSNLGIVNSKQDLIRISPYQLYVKALEQGKLFVKKTPTLVSLKTYQQYNPDICNMEVIKRIGHYVRFPIISFGKFREHFEPIKNKGGKIELLGLVSQLWKSTQISAMMMVKKLKYVILRKQGTDNYVVTSFDHFETYKSYFAKNQYLKHSVVDSMHFEGMTAENPYGKKIPIILEENKRGKGSQINGLCPSHTLADNEIAAELGIDISSTISEEGVLKVEEDEIAIDDENIESLLKSYLIKKELLMQNLNDIVDDTMILAENKQVLYLVPTEKLYLKIKDTQIHNLIEDLRNNTSIEQSKVVLPEPNPQEPMRGKWRRRFVKKLQTARDQQTDYYTLQQSLKLTQLCISTSNSKQYPIMVNSKKNKVVASQNNIRKMRDMIETNQVSLQDFQDLRQPFSQQKVFYLNQNFVRAAQVLHIDENSNLKNVAIQPQSATEGFLQYYLHVIAGLNLPFKMTMIKLHPTLKQTLQNVSIQTLIMGASKSNNMREYGWGYQAMRAWISKMDSHKGDRDVIEANVNQELPHCASIRKTLWKVLSILNKISPNRLKQIKSNTPQLPWFDQFMMDHIDLYILNMQKAYKRLDLSTAYELTLQFFKQYVQQIYIKSVRKSLISYYEEDSRLLVLERILCLVGVISPILPFTAYHVSQVQLHQWPKVQNVDFEKIGNYNKMIMMRVRLQNKLNLNRIKNSTIYIQGIEGLAIPQKQMALFLDVNEVVYEDPQVIQKFALKQDDKILRAYSYQSCYRCDSKYGNKKYLCRLCTEYLDK